MPSDRIAGIRLERLQLPLTIPYKLSFGPVTAFDTVIAEVIDTDGNTGLGEATILTGYTPETIDGCWESIRTIARDLVGGSFEAAKADTRYCAGASTSPTASTAGSRTARRGAAPRPRASRRSRSRRSASSGTSTASRGGASPSLECVLREFVRDRGGGGGASRMHSSSSSSRSHAWLVSSFPWRGLDFSHCVRSIVAGRCIQPIKTSSLRTRSSIKEEATSPPIHRRPPSRVGGRPGVASALEKKNGGRGVGPQRD